MTNDHQLLETVMKKYGWVSEPLFNGRAMLWSPRKRTNSSDSTILIPSDRNAPDYEFLLQTAVEKATQMIGGRFTVDLTYEKSVMEHLMDPLEIRRDPDTDRGFIPWGTGQTAYLSMTGMLSAGARAAFATKRVYRSTGHVIADSIMENALMGQTRIGSYVITALIPSQHPFIASTTQDPEKTPETISGRTITRKIVSALSAVRDGVEEIMSNHDSEDDSAFEVFDTLVQDGVSYEMVEALALLDGGESDISVSYRRDNPEDHIESFSFILNPPMVPILKKAGRHLSKPQEPQSVTVTGEVVQLSNSEEQPRHEIKLSAVVAKQLRTISVKLNGDQYSKAIEAHGNERMLSLHGVLEFHSGGSSITDPDMVRVTDTPIGGFDDEDNEIMQPALSIFD